MPDFHFCPLCGAALRRKPDDPDRGRPACPTGHFVHYDNPAVTTFAFIRRGGRYLMLRRAVEPYTGAWDMPGGFVEAGESPEECIRREIREETGLEIEIERVIGAYTSQYGDGDRQTVDIGYLCAARDGELRLSDEKSEAVWAPLEEFPQLAFEGERRGLDELRGSSEARPGAHR